MPSIQVGEKQGEDFTRSGEEIRTETFCLRRYFSLGFRSEHMRIKVSWWTLHEELRRAALGCRFFRNRFHTVLAIFVQLSFVIRVRPRAARTVDTVNLIQVGKRSDTSDQPRPFDRYFRRF